MNDDRDLAEVSREYQAAYAAHYSKRDLTMALRLYEKLIATHANAREATYSRVQVQNIVTAVVPREALLRAQIELARAHIDPSIATDSAANLVLTDSERPE